MILLKTKDYSFVQSISNAYHNIMQDLLNT